MLGIAHHLAFGDLELHVAGHRLILRDQRAHIVEQRFAGQLCGREVDRDVELLGQLHRGYPLPGLFGRFLEGEAAELFDLPGPLGERDEGAGADLTTLGMVPAHQRLGTDDPVAVLDIDDRLIEQLQVAAFERVLEVIFQRLGIDGDGAGRGAESLDAVAAMAFGVMHGKLGVAQDIFGFGRLVVVDGDPDRDGERHVAIAEIEGIAQRLAHLFGHVGNLGGRLLGQQHDSELVPRDAGQCVEGAQKARQPPGNGQKQRIGRHMANALVDIGEFVEIDEEDGGLDLVELPRPHERPFETVEKELAVRQPGKAVVNRVMQQPVAGGAFVGHVLQGAHDAVDLIVTAQHWFDAHAEGTIAAIESGDADI